MAQWGRNDQAVTANSTTTKETSNGAPIGTYALVKGAGNGTTPISMVANAHYGNTSSGSRANVDYNMFNSNTVGAYIKNMATGIYGVSATEMANNTTNKVANQPAHAGWVLRKAYTGPIVSMGITAGGTAYDNADVITVASPQPGGNATVAITTNSTGGVTALTITNPGAGFLAVDASGLISVVTAFLLFLAVQRLLISVGTANGTSGTFTATAGGRAGRVHTETLVAMGSLGSNTTSATGVVGAADTVADATTDNVYYPGR